MIIASPKLLKSFKILRLIGDNSISFNARKYYIRKDIPYTTSGIHSYEIDIEIDTLRAKAGKYRLKEIEYSFKGQKYRCRALNVVIEILNQTPRYDLMWSGGFSKRDEVLDEDSFVFKYRGRIIEDEFTNISNKKLIVYDVEYPSEIYDQTKVLVGVPKGGVVLKPKESFKVKFYHSRKYDENYYTLIYTPRVIYKIEGENILRVAFPVSHSGESALINLIDDPRKLKKVIANP